MTITPSAPYTVETITVERVAKTIDHSLLKPELTVADVLDGCAVAAAYDVASVCCRPLDVVRCRDALAGTDVLVGTVIGFPHGSHLTATKVFEAERAIEDGAVELDMVLAIGMLRSGEVGYVGDDIAAVVAAAGDAAIVKVILENAYLSDDEKVAGSNDTVELRATIETLVRCRFEVQDNGPGRSRRTSSRPSSSPSARSTVWTQGEAGKWPRPRRSCPRAGRASWRADLGHQRDGHGHDRVLRAHRGGRGAEGCSSQAADRR